MTKRILIVDDEKLIRCPCGRTEFALVTKFSRPRAARRGSMREGSVAACSAAIAGQVYVQD
jgi:hypothetical protein